MIQANTEKFKSRHLAQEAEDNGYVTASSSVASSSSSVQNDSKVDTLCPNSSNPPI